MENVKHCAVCKSENFSPLIDCTDHFVTHEVFSIQQCNNCGFCFTSPRPEENNIAPYYASEKYVSHSKTGKGLVNRLFHLSRHYTIRHKKRLVEKYSPGKNILDYGCGTGEFLQTMVMAGWSGYGIEPNEKARHTATEKINGGIGDESLLDEMADGSLQAITLWHVLEHIYPLEARLKSFHRLLDKKGMLFVALPNMQSYDAKRYGPDWAAWDVPRHIHHFSPQTIKKLMENNGFELSAIRPMMLDAFYISLLSEKYKTGKSNFLLAILHGMLSNLKAFFGHGHYSSLIYIFKKSD